MFESTFTPEHVLVFLNVAISSILVILAFSLLAYTFTYNFLNPVARRFALVLGCVMVTYASDVALNRVVSIGSAERWLRFQWLGIALLPAAYYIFSVAVLETTNYRVRARRWVAWSALAIGLLSALDGLFGRQLVGSIQAPPPVGHLMAGPFFWLFIAYFTLTILLALRNVWKAHGRCLTASSRQRMTYLLLGFVAPGIGVFPYLIVLGSVSQRLSSSLLVLAISFLGNMVVAVLLVIMSYTVAYFGVLTPDRVVRYRLIRFFMRGPIVAILVILAIQTVPTVEQILGVPRDIVLFSVITGVIVSSQLVLSVTKSWVDWLVYREDREEIAWLRELDRRLLTTSDLHQFLSNNLTALCELLRVPSGFVAAIVGPEFMLEATVGSGETREQILAVKDWNEALARALKDDDRVRPISHAGFWIWPLLEPNSEEKSRVLGFLGVRARTETPLLGQDERTVLTQMLERVASALADRRLQQGVFVSLRRIIPDIDRIQQWRNLVPYSAVESDTTPTAALLDPSPIHSPEFEGWVKDALSHYWGGPKLTLSPLVQLRVVSDVLGQADGDPTKALRLVLGAAIEKMRPNGKPNLSAPEWLLYNILEMRFIEGRKVREIADRLAMSESDLYRKQRVAIGQVARVLSEMEQENGGELEVRSPTAQQLTMKEPVAL
ncbi:MAG: histidine kinase N-terminal 7TM domain-containing protein [Caldilineaceae bacterium]